MAVRDRVDRERRVKRRLMVRFGTTGPDRTGFTKNLSRQGAFVRTNKVYRPGTSVQIEFVLADRTVGVWGRVAWAIRVPFELAHILECGMGLRFVDPGAGTLEARRAAAAAA